MHENIIKYANEPKSSFIKKIEYSYKQEFERRICERITVYFLDGKHLEYSPNKNIPNNFDFLYRRFITAESVGKFWHKEIKDKFEVKIIRKSNL